MALQLIPGAGLAVTAISTTAGIAEGAIGKENYNNIRNGYTWGYGALIGYVPFNPLLWPAQIAMMIIFILVLIYVFGWGVGYSFLGAWVLQGLVIMCAAQWFMDKLLRYGVGI